ncbi:MAG: nuclear transport factor 2 family protein [Chloroflexi bacterium]|nr:nuclear transport factor 2 family protein [Chloroflexota bacterium]MBP8058528.1 nuclear transport factor 2 family protein [Chloroflexota bacterium]
MTDLMISASDRYFAAVSRLDRALYLACFSPEATVHDPYGGRPWQGHEALGKFFAGMERTWTTFSMTPGEPFISGNRLATTWTAQGTSKTGKTATFAGINIFTLNEEGLISQLEAYWDFKAMLTQIS